MNSGKMRKAEQLRLEITDLRTFVVDTGGDENFVFVKVYTDQGLVGLGEGTLTGMAAAVNQTILEYKRLLVGRNPANIEGLWLEMYRGPRYRGGLVKTTAISAIEIGLWDILGQALGQPIWQLLGGKARDRVRIYPHAHHYGGRRMDADGRWIEGLKSETATESWLAVKEAGWTACKGGFLPMGSETRDNILAVKRGIADLEAVRSAVGDDFDIAIDLHGKPTPPMAVEFCCRAEALHPLFIEEATQPEDLGELAHLRGKTRAPLATGERLVTKQGFSEICARRLVDYVQPDVIHCGGILEMKKIAGLAETFGIQMAPHNPQSEVSTLASLHVCVNAPGAAILEIGSGMESFWTDLFCGGAVGFKNGYALPPDRPGLGIALDEEVAAKRPYAQKPWKILRMPDGSTGNR